MDSNNLMHDNGGLKDFTLPAPRIPEGPYLPRSSWHQLIIIGNGFDLECGLPSKFKNFYKPRFDCFVQSFNKVVESGYGEWGKHLYNQGLTVWDIILSNDMHSPWCDIEKAVGRWVAPNIGGHGENSTDHISEILEFFSRDTSPNVIFRETLRHGFRNTYFDAACYMYDTVEDFHNNQIDRDGVLYYLRKELKRLESEFASYLHKAIEEEVEYVSRSTELMRSLHSYILPDQDDFDVETTILSFNYTTPFGKFVQQDSTLVVNVHGSLDNEIIFGIDGKECMDDKTALPFTKTYRLMSTKTEPIEGLVYAATPGAQNSSTDVFKFYGHSLGEADYSYFQALFDSVDLYGGHTSLVFFYRPRGGGCAGTSDEYAKVSMVNKVIELLNVYGTTMDNKDHGKNIAHKLMLEGRLSIVRI
jgi:hypothetical protein